MSENERSAGKNPPLSAVSPSMEAVGGAAALIASAKSLFSQGRREEAVETALMAGAVSRSAGEHAAAGGLLRGLGRLKEAEDSYRKAVEGNTGSFDARFGLALTLHDQKRHGEAIGHYLKAVELDPESALARCNLGNAYVALSDHRKAEESYHGALSFDRDLAPAHKGLARILAQGGNFIEARARFRTALSIDPSDSDDWNDFGNLLFQMGRFGEAKECYRKSIEQNGGSAAACHNLGLALMEEGDCLEAGDHLLKAYLMEGGKKLRESLLLCLISSARLRVSEELKEFMAEAVEESWTRTDQLCRPSLMLLLGDPAVRAVAERVQTSWPRRAKLAELSEGLDLGVLYRDRLLAALMENTVCAALWCERMLTTLRKAMLYALPEGLPALGEGALDFSCSLACQCFFNEYVYDLDDGERQTVERLGEEISARLAVAADVKPFALVVYAQYEPLHSLPGAARLLEGSWPAPVEKVISMQLREPLAELELRRTIPSLTPIEDEVSLKVKDQYEENPYPRWTRHPEVEKLEVNEFFRKRFPLSTFTPLEVEGPLKVLVAGCGTGRHSVDTAEKFKDSEVLAIDLSLASLSYAKRKAQERAIANLKFGLADIMRLGETGLTFDVIESVGVLHHLGDPLAGWRVLTSLLRPGGFMNLGFYSELGRKSVVKAREIIAQRGFSCSATDIRRCRQELVERYADSETGELTNFRDFYGTSECRDLIFHVQERRFTIPELKRDMEEMGLEMVGILAPKPLWTAYGKRFPEDRAMTDLDSLHVFETENPSAFNFMYQFWVQKKG